MSRRNRWLHRRMFKLRIWFSDAPRNLKKTAWSLVSWCPCVDSSGNRTSTRIRNRRYPKNFPESPKQDRTGRESPKIDVKVVGDCRRYENGGVFYYLPQGNAVAREPRSSSLQPPNLRPLATVVEGTDSDDSEDSLSAFEEARSGTHEVEIYATMPTQWSSSTESSGDSSSLSGSASTSSASIGSSVNNGDAARFRQPAIRPTTLDLTQNGRRSETKAERYQRFVKTAPWLEEYRRNLRAMLDSSDEEEPSNDGYWSKSSDEESIRSRESEDSERRRRAILPVRRAVAPCLAFTKEEYEIILSALSILVIIAFFLFGYIF